MEGAVSSSECATHIFSRLTARYVNPPLSDKFILFPHRHLSLALLSLSDRIVAEILCL